MADPVTSLDQFFRTYLKRLKDKDADGLGALYAEPAVTTCIGAPGGDRLAVGRDKIVEQLKEALQQYTVLEEVHYGPDYTKREDDFAERYGTYVATVRRGRKRETVCIVAFEVLRRDHTEGWQYLSDHSMVVVP